MKRFQFAPARQSGGDHLDVINGGRASGWTFEDVRNAALQHSRVCGPTRTTEIAKAIMGDVERQPRVEEWSELIAHYTYEISKRPHAAEFERKVE